MEDHFKTELASQSKLAVLYKVSGLLIVCKNPEDHEVIMREVRGGHSVISIGMFWSVNVLNYGNFHFLWPV